MLMRIIAGLALLAGPIVALAATPESGTVTGMNPALEYTAGPFNVSNPTPGPGMAGPRCDGTTACDSFQLTVSVSAEYAANQPNPILRITLFWDTPAADLDLWAFEGSQASTDGSQLGAAHSAHGGDVNPEILYLPYRDASYTLKIVPFSGAGASARVKVELLNNFPVYTDRDGDGVTDGYDRCPGTAPGTRTNHAGCPTDAGDPASCTGVTVLVDDDDATEGRSPPQAPGTDYKFMEMFQPPPLPIIFALGNWGLDWRDGTPELRIRQELMRDEGHRFIEEFMDELRVAHLGAAPAKRRGPGPLERLSAAVVERYAFPRSLSR